VILCHSSQSVGRSLLGRFGRKPAATEAFTALYSKPYGIPKTVMESLERFVVLIYGRTSERQGPDEARPCVFSKTSRKIENIPTTSAALLENTTVPPSQQG